MLVQNISETWGQKCLRQGHVNKCVTAYVNKI